MCFSIPLPGLSTLTLVPRCSLTQVLFWTMRWTTSPLPTSPMPTDWDLQKLTLSVLVNALSPPPVQLSSPRWDREMWKLALKFIVVIAVSLFLLAWLSWCTGEIDHRWIRRQSHTYCCGSRYIEFDRSAEWRCASLLVLFVCAAALKVMSLGESVADAIKAKRLHHQLLPNTLFAEGIITCNTFSYHWSVVTWHCSWSRDLYPSLRGLSKWHTELPDSERAQRNFKRLGHGGCGSGDSRGRGGERGGVCRPEEEPRTRTCRRGGTSLSMLVIFTIIFSSWHIYIVWFIVWFLW